MTTMRLLTLKPQCQNPTNCQFCRLLFLLQLHFFLLSSYLSPLSHIFLNKGYNAPTKGVKGRQTAKQDFSKELVTCTHYVAHLQEISSTHGKAATRVSAICYLFNWRYVREGNSTKHIATFTVITNMMYIRVNRVLVMALNVI